MFFFFCTRQKVCLPSVVFAALSKELVCRVPEELHSANPLALGKSTDSGSASAGTLIVIATGLKWFVAR